MTMETKYFILIILAVAGLAVWMLPKASFASRISMTERSYVIIHWIGLISGLIGIVLTFMFPTSILREHIYELVLLPVVAAYAVYPAIVARVTRSNELYDEKQIWDTTRAAALSLGGTTMTMFMVYAYYNEGVLSGVIWFPLMMFSVVAWYSGGTLIFHRSS